MTDIEVRRRAIGVRLREAREYLDLSQSEVAGMVGISRSAISLVESGQRKIDAIELSLLAELYGQSERYFLHGEQGEPDQSYVQHLARAVSSLSQEDRDEVLRFAEFRAARKKRS